MKKILLIITLLFFVVAGAMAQNNAIYVYRNDGEFNAFLKSDVDSMRYSYLDADSIFHNDWQMQEVFTADSIYRIPLAAIDSISFVTPEPIYKKDVRVITDEWTDYVISYTDSTIHFNSSIPLRLLPKIGYIVAVKSGNATFPDGFAGRMEGVQNMGQEIQANFSTVQLQEVYSRLIAVGSATSYNCDNNTLDSRKRIAASGKDASIVLPQELGFELETDNASFCGQFIEPSLQVDYIICIWEDDLKNSVLFKYNFESKGKIITSLKKDGDMVDKTAWSKPLRFAPFGVPCSLRAGAFIELSGSIDLNAEFPFHLSSDGGFEFDENYGYKYDHIYGMKKLPSKTTFSWEEPEWGLNMDGSLYAGAALEFAIGLAFEKIKVAQADVTIRSGLELSSSFNIASNGGIYTSGYEALVNTKVDLALKTDVTFGYSVFLCSNRQELPFSLYFVHMKSSTSLLPLIENPSWKSLGVGKGTLSANASNDTFMSCQLGWALYDGDNLVRKDYLPEKYRLRDRWSLDGLLYIYRDLPSSFSYKAYPLIRLMNMEIRVPGFIDIRSDFPVHITDFMVNNTYHCDGAYYNDGLSYDYKFEAATTITIDKNEDISAIEDWGYVYKDPYGNEKQISLMPYGTSFKDTRYAYYRNEPNSTVCLYGYIKYKGDNECYYDTPRDYPLVYKGFDATISELWGNTTTYKGKMEDGGYVHYELSANTVTSTLDDAEDWGVYVYNADTSEYNFYSSKNDKIEMRPDWVYFELDVCKQKFDDLNDETFEAKKSVSMGVYKKLKETNDAVKPIYLYGEPSTFELIYDERPCLTFTNNELRGDAASNGYQYYFQFAGTAYYDVKGGLWIQDIMMKPTLGNGKQGTCAHVNPSEYGDGNYGYSYECYYYTYNPDTYNTIEGELLLTNGSVIKASNYLSFGMENGVFFNDSRNYGSNKSSKQMPCKALKWEKKMEPQSETILTGAIQYMTEYPPIL